MIFPDMFPFFRKLWDLVRPYRGRLLLGVLAGILGGVIEPLMIATVTFVYGMIFPSAHSCGGRSAGQPGRLPGHGQPLTESTLGNRTGTLPTETLNSRPRRSRG